LDFPRPGPTPGAVTTHQEVAMHAQNPESRTCRFSIGLPRHCLLATLDFFFFFNGHSNSHFCVDPALETKIRNDLRTKFNIFAFCIIRPNEHRKTGGNSSRLETHLELSPLNYRKRPPPPASPPFANDLKMKQLASWPRNRGKGVLAFWSPVRTKARETPSPPVPGPAGATITSIEIPVRTL